MGVLAHAVTVDMASIPIIQVLLFYLALGAQAGCCAGRDSRRVSCRGAEALSLTPSLAGRYHYILARIRLAVASSSSMTPQRGRLAVGLLGGAATLLLHSFFFAVAMWGGTATHRFPDRPDAVGAGANIGKPEGESTERRMTVVLLSDVNSRPSPMTLDAYLAEQVSSTLKLEITGPDAMSLPSLVFEQNAVPAESSDAELMARTKLAGIYESQIRARIERAWMLPEVPSPAQGFSCRALIRQHRDGRVSEVELPYDSCEGSSAMRQSLINAIFAASPLPAPPHPGVFVDSFSLTFRSETARRHR